MNAGHVDPGGPPLVEQIGPGLTLSKLSVGPMDNNAYLLIPDDAPAVLIDAAAEPDRLRALIGDTEVGTIVTTHRHHDHIGALAELARDTGARLVAGRPDAAAIADATGTRPEPVWTGDAIGIGGSELAVLGLVGHTPGSIALAYRPGDGRPTQLFTGDSLFPGGPGKTANPTDFGSLMDDLESSVFGAFDDATVVRPGHGDDTTLGAERPHLTEWRDRGW
ncbi:glyoxylase-like metal-dependent hydrolase (beta-lactamase superfamily II) [Naumannella cuiyingiana]|uniref:Glyoxylase-like metal-dependent hydrolase (Beta-lactamase superfamily II) n=1 Tax=Naumannella cuiyingiana TaxID=1347891 RepID=A0A7Z0IM23_9ACTN|nr:MBL fold metallo-hydrolase [Naumannella cuiyingiana]NYI72127.1 glyoxylase-like metal-dependent hydrolase (beta-lactamase superfamily II) [Naumannella cuiyingiana]